MFLYECDTKMVEHMPSLYCVCLFVCVFCLREVLSILTRLLFLIFRLPLKQQQQSLYDLPVSLPFPVIWNCIQISLLLLASLLDYIYIFSLVLLCLVYCHYLYFFFLTFFVLFIFSRIICILVLSHFSFNMFYIL